MVAREVLSAFLTHVEAWVEVGGSHTASDEKCRVDGK